MSDWFDWEPGTPFHGSRWEVPGLNFWDLVSDEKIAAFWQRLESATLERAPTVGQLTARQRRELLGVVYALIDQLAGVEERNEHSE